MDISKVIAWSEQQPQFATYENYVMPEEALSTFRSLSEFSHPMTLLSGLHVVLQPFDEVETMNDICRLAPLAIPFGFAMTAKLNRGLIDALVKHLLNPSEKLNSISVASAANMLYGIIQNRSNRSVKCLYSVLFDHYFDAVSHLSLPKECVHRGNLLRLAIIDTLEITTNMLTQSSALDADNSKLPKAYEN